MPASNDTYQGSLEVLMKQIAQMKMLADANLPFLIDLETMVIEEARNPERLMQQAGVLPPEGRNPQSAGAMGMPPGAGMAGGMGGGPGQGVGMPPGLAAPPPTMGGGGVPGVASGPPPVNPDEMRRALTAPGQ